MRIKISNLINSSILNSEWIGFTGDSEYVDADGELQLGYWTFIGIIEYRKGKTFFEIDDEIPEEVIHGNHAVLIRNENDNVCMVEFKYRKEE